MNHSELHRIEARLARLEADVRDQHAKLTSTVFWLAVIVLSYLFVPALLVPMIIAYIIRQFIDVLHRRSLRKRREQLVVQQLSGRGSYRQG